MATHTHFVDCRENAEQTSLLDSLSRRGFIRASACIVAGLSAMRATAGFAQQDYKQLIIMERSAGVLLADPALCVGCQRCEMACTEFNDGKADPKLARIKVSRNLNYGPAGAAEGVEGQFGNGLVVQDACRQCPHPVPCSTACPHHAIIAQPGTGTRIVDPEKCIGCRTCLNACPWNMMAYNEEKGKADKCFLCNGAPKCVEACPAQALRYVPWSDRSKFDRLRGSFLLNVPPEKERACRSCHVDDPGEARNRVYPKPE